MGGRLLLGISQSSKLTKPARARMKLASGPRIVGFHQLGLIGSLRFSFIAAYLQSPVSLFLGFPQGLLLFGNLPDVGYE
jgi:hypothetical protein